MSVRVEVAAGAGKYVDVDTGLKTSATSGSTDSNQIISEGISESVQEIVPRAIPWFRATPWKSLANGAVVRDGGCCKDELLIPCMSVDSSVGTKRCTPRRDCCWGKGAGEYLWSKDGGCLSGRGSAAV
jgi:hypothetical protein